MDKKSLPKINKNVIKRLFGYISAYKFKLLIVSISIIIVSLSMVADTLPPVASIGSMTIASLLPIPSGIL